MFKWTVAAWGASLILGELLMVSVAQADDLRCGQELAHTGDSSYEVRSMCGEPAHVDRHVEERRVTRRATGPCANGDRSKSCSVVESVNKEVVVERWTYDFGRRAFMQHLTFEDDRLVSIRRGDYGRRDTP